MILTIATSKGGVGKSTTVTNLAAAWSEAGRRVLVVDLDPGFTASRMLGVVPERGRSSFDLLVGEATVEQLAVAGSAGVDVVPAHRDLTGLDLSLANTMHREYRLASKLEGYGYDLVLLDTPPAGTLITVNALVASDYALAILSCEDAYSLQGVQELRMLLDSMRGGPAGLSVDLLGLVPTFVDRASTIYAQLMAHEEVAQLPLLKSEIPLRRELRKSGLAGVPQVIYAPDSITACAYRRLRDELDQTIELKEIGHAEITAHRAAVDHAGQSDGRTASAAV